MPDAAGGVPSPAEECATGRLQSLDVLRGLAVLGMIFVNNVVAGPGVPRTLRHAAWNGITFADTIFPSFVFILGVSMAYSFGKIAGRPSREVYARFLFRVVLLFALGVLGNLLFAQALGSTGVRIPGILQRIALASLLAAPFTRTRTRWTLTAAVAFLGVHALLLMYAAPPGVVGGATATAPGSTIAAWFDRWLLGPGYGTGLDPENFLGTLSAAGGALLGVAAGRTLIRHCRKPRGLVPLLAGAVVALATGFAISPVLPPNKRLWTASFVLVVSALDTLVLLAMYVVVDRRGHRKVASLAVPPGRNALVLFFGSELGAALMLWLRAPNGVRLYNAVATGLQSSLGAVPGSMLFAAAHVAFWYAVSWVLHARRLYIKL